MRLRLLLLLTIAALFGGVRAYSQCDVEAERSHYTLEEVKFESGNAFPAGQLRDLIPIVSGGAFSVSRIRDGLRAIRTLYDENGYINFTIIPEAQCDRDRRSVRLTLTLDEGSQFRLAKLLILAPKGVADRLYSAWPVKPGAIYDTKLVHEFFLQNRALLPAGWNLADGFAASLDEKSKSIEVRLNVCPTNQVCPQATREF